MHGLLQVEQAQALGAESQVKESIKERIEAAVDICETDSVRMGQK